MELKEQEPDKYELTKECIYNFFEKHLALGDIAMGSEGKNFDTERKLIDTIVIHHTHETTSTTKERLSAIELLRLYAPQFSNPSYEGDKDIKGKPIYSGHFRDGKQVFYPYHWIIRKIGSAERLLFDNEIGWHAGNWEVNCRSIAITLDNDYENSEPSSVELTAIAKIIKENYPFISKDKIVGHREVNQKTTCPSNFFLSKKGICGWKDILFEIMKI